MRVGTGAAATDTHVVVGAARRTIGWAGAERGLSASWH